MKCSECGVVLPNAATYQQHLIEHHLTTWLARRVAKEIATPEKSMNANYPK